MKQISNVSRLLVFAFSTLSATAAVAVHAQYTNPSDGPFVTWSSVACEAQLRVCGRQHADRRLFAQSGLNKVGLLSHGSRGVGSPMYDYVDALKAENIAALVIGHLSPSGFCITYENYDADRLRREKGFTPIGSINQSLEEEISWHLKTGATKIMQTTSS